MSQVSIRIAALPDLEDLRMIGRETFQETFSRHNTASDMEKYLELNYQEAQVKAELENPASFFFIAIADGVTIGYLKLNIGAAQTELKEDAGLEIERIYVLASHHGSGTGQLLYETAIDVALSLHKSYVWLGVWEANARAIRFYEKNGFVKFDQHFFMVGDDQQVDIMMKRQIVTYRIATSADIPSMARLRALTWGSEDYWAKRIASYWKGELNPQRALAPRVMYVAVNSGRVVGLITGHLTERFDCQGELEWIDVDPDHRGMGIADELLKLLAKWMVERAAFLVCVNCASDNAPAQRFYRRSGAEDLSPHWLVWKDIRLMLT